jgi:2-phosphoglycerate kinase
MMSESERQLNDVFWLGGSPCAGKSSISEIVARRFGLDVYHVDQAFESHEQSFDPLNHPALAKWSETSWNQRWMKPVESLVQEVIACYQEHFTLVLEDIVSLPKREALLIEGTALLPAQVAGLLPCQSRALWLIPTADFQRQHYRRREWVRTILAQCSKPEEAFHNWMERDVRFARWIETEARANHLSSLKVDGSRTMEQNAETVARHFGLLVDQPEE